MAMVEKIKNKLRGNGFLLAVTIVLFFVLYIAGAILYGDRNFTSPQVFLNLFISNAGLIIAAVGMTFCTDHRRNRYFRSVPSSVLFCMMLAWMMEVKHMSAVVAIILVLAFGVIFGLVQGFLVAYLKIQPFIVTLGGMFFARGLTALISSDMISIENPTFFKSCKLSNLFWIYYILQQPRSCNASLYLPKCCHCIIGCSDFLCDPSIHKIWTCRICSRWK